MTLQLSRLWLFVLTVPMAAILPGKVAFACACCSHEGQRSVSAAEVDDFSLGVLNDIQFADRAELFTGGRDVESLDGISTATTEFHLTVSKTDDEWAFTFAGDDNEGTLLFSLPEIITRFEIDPREANDAGNPDGPVLYKEWRLSDRLEGSGMFEGNQNDDAQLTLILHGRGNSCTEPSQFNAWTVVLDQSGSQLKLFGDLQAL